MRKRNIIWERWLSNNIMMPANPDTLQTTRSGSLAIIMMIFENLVPLAGVIWWSWTVASVQVLYWVETVIIGLMNIPCIMATGDGFS